MLFLYCPSESWRNKKWDYPSAGHFTCESWLFIFKTVILVLFVQSDMYSMFFIITILFCRIHRRFLPDMFVGPQHISVRPRSYNYYCVLFWTNSLRCQCDWAHGLHTIYLALFGGFNLPFHAPFQLNQRSNNLTTTLSPEPWPSHFKSMVLSWLIAGASNRRHSKIFAL